MCAFITDVILQQALDQLYVNALQNYYVKTKNIWFLAKFEVRNNIHISNFREHAKSRVNDNNFF